MVRAKKSLQKNNDELSFEAALASLEVIIKQLEQGDLPLEESLKQFSQGIQLSQVCLAKLNFAEDQIDIILSESNGKLIEKPLPMQEEN